MSLMTDLVGVLVQIRKGTEDLRARPYVGKMGTVRALGLAKGQGGWTMLVQINDRFVTMAPEAIKIPGPEPVEEKKPDG